MDASIVELLRGLEEALWRPATRFDREWMDRHVTDDVVEFGQSGRVYDKAAMLEPMSGEIDVVLPLPEFSVAEIAPDVALITYRSVWTIGEEVLHTNRTSIWIRTGDGWRLRFHQGTPQSDAPGG
jgi:ribonuclease HI